MDSRDTTAKFYDLNPDAPNDVPFYVARIPHPHARVLELGCGTGRVLIPLSAHSSFIHGLDSSEAMLQICRTKLASAGVPAERATVSRADITAFALGDRFDFIIAPFRVMQNLETDEQLDGLFRCVRTHLAPRGRCILNAFDPNGDRESIRTQWVKDEEHLAWEVRTDRDRVTCHDIRSRIDGDHLILYPKLVYRRFEGNAVVEEAILEIPMRCHYPDDLLSRIEAAGFRVTGTWGGYSEEEYGRGGELVVEFALEG